MDENLSKEILYAAEAGSLCLFLGTGFSKAITENRISIWETLLLSLCDKMEEGDG
jgi:hypothetical protein